MMKTRTVIIVFSVVAVFSSTIIVTGWFGADNIGHYSRAAVLNRTDFKTASSLSSCDVTVPQRSQNTGFLSIENESSLQELAMSEGWPGSGAGDDPFIIEGYDFTYIRITDIELHIILRNNTIGPGETVDVISLKRVSHLRMENNTVTSSKWSLQGLLNRVIWIFHCSDVWISGNNLRADIFVWGIQIFLSNQITIIDNHFDGYDRDAITVTSSEWITIAGNYLYLSILDYENTITVDTCRAVVIVNNTLKDDGYVYVSTSSIVDIRDNFIDDEITAKNSHSVDIVNNTCGYRFVIETVDSLLVENNTVIGYIEIKLSSHGTVSGNTINGTVSGNIVPGFIIEDCQQIEEMNNKIINRTKKASTGGSVVIVALIGLSLLNRNKEKDR
ncbi:MAG: hypothetical protein ACFFD4_33805 [Candidatus Odinarchaeota archaeon]